MSVCRTTAGCATCGGAGWLRRPWDPSRGPRELGLERCRCNPAPTERLAEAERARVYGDESDAQGRVRRNRREWWAR